MSKRSGDISSGQNGPTKRSDRGPSAPEDKKGYFFDPWIIASGDTAKGFLEFLETDVRKAEALTRKRRRKDKDLKSLRELVRLVFANLAYAFVAGYEPPSVAIPLAKPSTKKSRYQRPGLRQLPQLLQTLVDQRLIVLNKSRRVGRASTITPSNFLRPHLARAKFKFEAFARSPGEETIILSRTTRDHAAGTGEATTIDYIDTEETITLRNQMKLINERLRWADIHLQSKPDNFDTGPNRRVLRRIFNVPPWMTPDKQTFEFGGRCYHGWWQNLGADWKNRIWINVGGIADLDFQSMFLRLSYLQAGHEPPGGDLYSDIAGLAYREGVKQIVNAMLFRQSPMTRLPKGSRELLPGGTTAKEIRGAIMKAHPALAAVFETGIGYRLMRTESDILVAVLLDLIENNITALPMHDGIMVPRRVKWDAAETMMNASEKLVGYRLPVKVSEFSD